MLEKFKQHLDQLVSLLNAQITEFPSGYAFIQKIVELQANLARLTFSIRALFSKKTLSGTKAIEIIVSDSNKTCSLNLYHAITGLAAKCAYAGIYNTAVELMQQIPPSMIELLTPYQKIVYCLQVVNWIEQSVENDHNPVIFAKKAIEFFAAYDPRHVSMKEKHELARLFLDAASTTKITDLDDLDDLLDLWAKLAICAIDVSTDLALQGKLSLADAKQEKTLLKSKSPLAEKKAASLTMPIETDNLPALAVSTQLNLNSPKPNEKKADVSPILQIKPNVISLTNQKPAEKKQAGSLKVSYNAYLLGLLNTLFEPGHTDKTFAQTTQKKDETLSTQFQTGQISKPSTEYQTIVQQFQTNRPG